MRETLTRWGLLEPGAEREDVLERLGVKVRKVTTWGSDPAKAVTEYVGRRPARLLVAGTAGRTGLARLVRPSVAAEIPRRAGLITLFLPASTGGLVRRTDTRLSIGRIMVPADVAPFRRPRSRGAPCA